MAAILFSDFDALRLVLTSGAVPASVANAPARWGVDAKGRVWLEPSVPLPKTAATALNRFGALVQGTSGADSTEPVLSWPFVLPLDPRPSADAKPLDETILFDLPQSEIVPRFVAELRRMGAGKIGFRTIVPAQVDNLSDRRALLLVEKPPLGTLLRALDRTTESPRAYFRQAPRVWVEVGHRHPLAEQISPPQGHVAVLSAPRAYQWLHDEPFHTGPGSFQLLRSEPDVFDLANADWNLPIDVRLQPTPSPDPPELWVVPESHWGELHELISRWDDRVVGQFQLAQVECGGLRLAILRARRARDGTPIVAPDGVIAYRPVLRMPNLFAPIGMQLKPPLRRDLLRQWLAADADTLVWLWPTVHGRFERHGLPLASFRPLSEFLHYRIEQPAELLSPLDEPTILPLSAFLVREPAPAAARPSRKPPPSPVPKPLPPAPATEGWLQKLGKWFSPLFGRTEEPVLIHVPPPRTRATMAPADTSPPPRHAWEQHRLDMESRLLSADLSDEDRRTLWPELAGLYSALNQPVDSAACWLHALWENESDSPRWARGWLAAEARTANPETELEQWLTGPSTPEHARALAAFVVWATAQETLPANAATLLARVQRVLDEQESGLPVQAVWLSRVAFGQLIGGDAVGLARCRDRLLDRLFHNGLSADLDAPNFVRFAGQVTDERRQQVREFLERVREPMQRWVAQELLSRTGTDMRLPQFGLGVASAPNRGYVDLMTAWGVARLGERAASHAWAANARQSIPADDPVHEFLMDAFAFRTQQALEGHGRHGPLAAEFRDRLTQFAERERADPAFRENRVLYTIDRFRQMSRILEPDERVRAFEEGHLERSTLREISDRDQLAARLTELLDGPYEQLPAALALSLDLAPRVGESFAGTVLDRLLSVVDRWGFIGDADQVESEVTALERGWFVAAHFDRTEAARHLLDGFGRLLNAQNDAGAKSPAAESAVLGLIGQALRGLRRLGLRADADRLLDRLGEWASPKSPDLSRVAQLIRRLHIAGGWFYVGRDLDATSALDDSRLVLLSRRLLHGDQSQLAYAYVNALGHAPVRIALGRIQEVFEQVENVFDHHATNSHFSLARLRVVEAAVLAVVNDDFALGPTVRRWLDDDEFRVRRRIQRDMARMGGGESE